MRIQLAVTAGLAAGVFLGLRLYVGSLQQEALRQAAEAARGGDAGSVDGPTLAPRPVGEIARSLRALKLVTVELETTVESTRVDESWRGDVVAKVDAPARLLFGCDLSGIDQPGSGSGLRADLLGGGLTLRVPRPERIATEVNSTGERTQVAVGWGRFRDLGGEYHLGQARARLYEQARALQLSAEQWLRVEEATREQLTRLVRALAAGGDDVPVRVEFFGHEGDAMGQGVAGASVGGHP